MFEKYFHHAQENWVISKNKGLHWDNCLCKYCAKFDKNKEANCEIAQATYENCKKFNTVTPMWECPQFSNKGEL